jgi:exosortase D (VPLPA-CTERM-specific)
MHSLLRGSRLALYGLLAVAAIAAVVPFAGMLAGLYNIWSLDPEYSHGIVIPLISAFLIWRRRAELRELPFTGSWTGLLLIAAGLGLRVLGGATTMYTLEHYGFLLVLYGLVLALTGPVIFRRLWMPLLILIFAIPLPSVFGNALSLHLQLYSSQLGVWFIRMAGVSVLLEGNVIDLGSYQLEVAEACSGLRYLFPLMTLAFILAYLYRAPWWKRGLLFLSSIPITVVMNSLRIAFIGITVDRWGPGMAQGALHGFEGWFVFMLSTAVLVVVAFLLTRFGHTRTPWREAFDLGALRPPGTAQRADSARAARTPSVRGIPRTFIAACVLLLAGDVAGAAMPPPHVVPPGRIGFDEFPTRIGDWTGRREVLDRVYLDKLDLDDYVLADYREPGGAPINLYVAYYQTQDTTRAIHSPQDCIPGGGWQIVKLERRRLPAGPGGGAIPVNRAIIALGSNREIVYYWFQERGRHLTNEYLARWYLFWDALMRHRTDGALVRYVAPFPPGAQESKVDAHILKLAALVDAQLARFVPN